MAEERYASSPLLPPDMGVEPALEQQDTMHEDPFVSSYMAGRLADFMRGANGVETGYSRPALVEQNIRLGRDAPVGRGLLKEYTTGIVSSGRSAVSGYLSTISALTGLATTTSRARREEERYRGHLRPGRELSSKIFHALGSGTYQAAEMIGLSVLTGGVGRAVGASAKGITAATTAGIITNSFMRETGDSIQTLLDMGVESEVAYVFGIFEGLVAGGVEVAFGPERAIAKNAGRMWTAGALRQVAKNEGMASILGAKARQFMWQPTKSFGMTLLGETQEEFLTQGYRDLTRTVLLADNQFNPSDYLNLAIYTPIETLPMALLGMGMRGIHNSRIRNIASTAAEDPSPDTLALAHQTRLEDGSVKNDPDSILRTWQLAQTFAREIEQAKQIGKDRAAALATTVFNVSVNMAARDSSMTPDVYMKNFRVAMLKTRASKLDALIAVLSQDRPEEARVVAALEEAIPNFRETITRLGDVLETEELKTVNDGIEQEIRDKAAEDDVTLYADDDKEGLKSLAAELAAAFKGLDIAPGQVQLFEIPSQLTVTMLPEKIFAAAYARGHVSGVRIGDIDYTLFFRGAATHGDGRIVAIPDDRVVGMEEQATIAAAGGEQAIGSGIRLTHEQLRKIKLGERDTAYDEAFAIYSALAAEPGEFGLAVRERPTEVAWGWPLGRNIGVVPQAVLTNPFFGIPVGQLETLGNFSLTSEGLRMWMEQEGLTETHAEALSELLGDESKLKNAWTEYRQAMNALTTRKTLPPATEAVGTWVAGQRAFARPVETEANPFLSLPYAVIQTAAKEGNQLAVDAKKTLDARSKSVQQHRLKDIATVRPQSTFEALDLLFPRGYGGVFLAEGEVSKPLGMYLKGANVAIYFANATPDVIIHEWFHHLTEQELLPKQDFAVLQQHFGTGDNKDWTPASAEASVEALIAYISEGTLPRDASAGLARAFQTIQKSFKQAYQLILQRHGVTDTGRSTILAPEVQATFDTWFGAIEAPNEAEQAIGNAVQGATENANDYRHIEQEVLLDSLHLERMDKDALYRMAHLKTLGGRAAFEAYRDSLGKKSTKDLTENEIRSHIYVQSQMLGFVSQETLKQAALDRFSQSWEDCQDTQKNSLLLEIKRSQGYLMREVLRRERREQWLNELRTQTKERSRAVIAEMNQAPRSRSMRARAIGGESVFVSVRQKIENIIKNARRFEFWRRMNQQNFSNIWTLAYYLADGQEQGALFRNIVEPWEDMIHQYGMAHKETSNWVSERKKVLGGWPQNWAKMVEVGGIMLSMNEVIGIYMQTRGDPDNILADVLIKSGQDLGPNPKQTIIDSASRVREDVGYVKRDAQGNPGRVVYGPREGWQKINPAMNFVTLSDEYFAWIFPKLDQAHVDATGTHMGRVEQGYFPLIREDGWFLEDDTMVKEGIFPTAEESLVDTEARTKPRTLKSRGKISLDALSIFNKYLNQADNYRAKAPMIATLNAIINQDVKLAIRERFGDARLAETLENLLKREQYATGRMTPMDGVDQFLREVRTNWSTAMLIGNVSAVIRQPISFVGGLAEMPQGHLGKAAVNFFRVLFQAFRYPVTRNPFADMEMYKRIEKYAPEVLLGRADPEFEDIETAKSSNAIMNRPFLGRPLRDWGMGAFRTFDLLAVIPLWNTAFEAKLAETSLTMREDQAIREAARFATGVVQKTQPPRTVSERTLWQTDREWKRALTPFTGQLTKDWQYLRTHVVGDLRLGWQEDGFAGAMKVFWSGKDAQSTSIKKRLFFKFFLVPMLIGMTFRKRLPEEDEWWLDIITFNFTSVPILGPALSTKMLLDWRDSPTVPFALEMFDVTARIMKDVLGKDITKDTIYEGIELMSRRAGISYRITRGLRDLVVEDPTLLELAGWKRMESPSE